MILCKGSGISSSSSHLMEAHTIITNMALRFFVCISAFLLAQYFGFCPKSNFGRSVAYFSVAMAIEISLSMQMHIKAAARDEAWAQFISSDDPPDWVELRESIERQLFGEECLRQMKETVAEVHANAKARSRKRPRSPSPPPELPRGVL